MISNKLSIHQTLLLFALAALTIRLVSLGLLPLMDTTEARYGEIARIMMETGNWITPQFDYNVPFWGKPPLHTWMSALGFQWLGVSEFAGRLPHFLTGLVILGLVWLFMRKWRDSKTAAIAAGILATTAAFCISIGAIMTDTALLLAVTLTMGSFWQAWQLTESAPHNKHNIWGYMFFIGLAIGLLAKGPIALILTGIPVFLWCLPNLRILQLWKRLPWIPGILIMLTIALPWYLLAERATPGFLDYFIVGEHFKRFVVSGWEGDLYGHAHNRPTGAIWLLWLFAATPWNLMLPVAWWMARRHRTVHNSDQNKNVVVKIREWRLFLWCWMLTPMIFFTLAGNILWTYVLPGIPALAMLVADYIQEFVGSDNFSETNKIKQTRAQWVTYPGAILPVLLMAALLLVANVIPVKSAKGIVEVYQRQADSHQTHLVFWKDRPFSGQFYSRGQAPKIEQASEIAPLISNETGSLYLIIRPDDQQNLFDSITGRLEKVAETKGRQLWKLSEFTDRSSNHEIHLSLLHRSVTGTILKNVL